MWSRNSKGFCFLLRTTGEKGVSEIYRREFMPDTQTTVTQIEKNVDIYLVNKNWKNKGGRYKKNIA